MTPAVVLTGARAPATLDLARRFAEEGYRVVVADSEPTATARSQAVTTAYRVPSARFAPREFAAAIAGIADRHDAELVVPTCEEIFWLTAVADEGSADGEPRMSRLRDMLFAPSLPTLRVLHDKAEFVGVLRELGIAHPQTEVFESAVAWRHLARRRERGGAAVVVKPAFSRFGTRASMVAADAPLPAVARVTRAERWLVQEHVRGREFCTFAVAVAGEVTAFVAYRPAWRAGAGAGVAFERLAPDAPPALAARAVCERLARATDLTGQFGLDLMQTDTDVVVLECNPRATSGIHLFAPGDGLAGAYRGRPAAAPGRAAARLALPHALYAAAGTRSLRDAATFVQQLSAPDALRPAADRVPLGALLRSVAVRAAVARRTGLGLLAGSTYDLEWNGEPLPPRPSAAPDGSGGAPGPGNHDPEWNGEPLPPRPSATPSGSGDASAPSPHDHGWSDEPPPPRPSAVPSGSGGAPGPGAAAAFVAELARRGVTASIANVDGALTRVGTVRLGDVELPVTIARAGARGRPPQSYVVSPVSHYVHYAREELGELRSPIARRLASALITGLAAVLRAGSADDVVFAGNALVSTNLLPELRQPDVERLTRQLAAEHPQSAIAWRSVHGRGSTTPEVLRRAGYRLIPSRSVLFTATRGTDWLRARDTMRDARLLAESGYEVVAAPIDPATGRSDEATRDRIAVLYSRLYLEKYSALNPAYTAEFIGAAQASGLLRFVLLVRDGRIDGAFGYSTGNGLLAAPVLGYDTALPPELGLYRMLSYLIARTASDLDLDLHGSSGVADFKRNRGAENELEYTAVFWRHLPWRRRAAWWVLHRVVAAVAAPLARRNGF